MSTPVRRLRRELRRNPGPVVAILVLAGAALAAGAWNVSRQVFVRPWGSYYRVSAAISNVKGVLPGKTEVDIAGVPVGLVAGEHLSGGSPVLSLAIDRRYAPVYRDATVQLRPATVLQDMFVDLHRGTRPAGAMPAGGTITAAQTSSPVDISQVMNTFDPVSRQRLWTLLDELSRGLPDGGARLRAAFAQLVPFMQNARAITGALADERSLLPHVIHNSQLLVSALGAQDNELAALVRNADASLGALASEPGPLGVTLHELPSTLQSVQASLQAVAAAEGDIDPALSGLRPVARELAPGLEALRTFALEADPAARALTGPVRWLQPLARGLANAAPPLAQALARLGGETGSIDRISGTLVPCLPALGRFAQRYLSVTALGDSLGAFQRNIELATPGLAGAPDPTLGPISTCTGASSAP
jgi:phospholipid/cholesterol/gamma-HCH transport system substrate-binding protein